jgi:hypothetical protein
MTQTTITNKIGVIKENVVSILFGKKPTPKQEIEQGRIIDDLPHKFKNENQFYEFLNWYSDLHSNKLYQN